MKEETLVLRNKITSQASDLLEQREKNLNLQSEK